MDGSDRAGMAMLRLVEELYPICRSITGEGLRRTLRRLARDMPLRLVEVPSGTPAFDWTVPDEWNVREAYIATLDGRRVVDFADHNLHLVQYSEPIDRVVPLEELKPHLHSLPDAPHWIPYRTAYYARSWGFCLTQHQLNALTEPAYRVVIDTSLAPGHLTYGELVLPGARAEEVLFSCHVCHPSLANDNLSAIAVASFLARRLMSRERRFTYRFLFIPGTIGSLVWLSRNEDVVPRVRWGLVLAGIGDAGALTYKQSRRGAAVIDRLVPHALRELGLPYEVTPFIPYGYDERQYCSPGFDMPVGCLMRSPWGSYPEYHTSADSPGLLRPESLAQSLAALEWVVEIIEGDAVYVSRSPKGEPQLGRRGLYRPLGGAREAGGFDQMTLLWVLNLADGRHSLLDMAERSGHPFAAIKAAAEALAAKELLERMA